MPHMARRQKQLALKKHVQEAMTKCGLIFSPMIQPPSTCLLQKRKRRQAYPTYKRLQSELLLLKMSKTDM